ncbi:MAG: Fic family protein [Candidatus Melainabacteria bacterium]|nr:Fic family protein [Candidatus Melainabacteria bacterium]
MKLSSKKTAFFQDRHIPPNTSLLGYSALVQAFDVQAPVRHPSCLLKSRTLHGRKQHEDWTIFDSKYAVEETVEGHLVFALKHENLDLLVLKRIFVSIPEKVMENYVLKSPTGQLTRRIWFLFEFLTDRKLNVPDAGKVTAVELLDNEKYFVSTGEVSARHRIRNNLLGNENFCPVVRKTEALRSFIAKDLSARAMRILDKVSPVVIARAASFLLLADTQASFAIEQEKLPTKTQDRWLRAIRQVGSDALNEEELLRLHEIIIGDFRFTQQGFRTDAVYLGKRTSDNEPLPEFIGANQHDLQSLLSGLTKTSYIMGNSDADAVIQAAAISFGFVYIHPFEDGNGRVQRCLIHHILAVRNFNPKGMIFPVSSVMLKRIDEYRKVLQAHSSPLMSYIEWTGSDKGNVSVHNDTADLYRFFDCTLAATFLYKCVEETIEKDVPEEIDYLRRHDRAMGQILTEVQMPNRLAEDFIMFMRQNDWTLPKRRREKEFALLSNEEVVRLEQIVRNAFRPES